jgi:hypothetical protein
VRVCRAEGREVMAISLTREEINTIELGKLRVGYSGIETHEDGETYSRTYIKESHGADCWDMVVVRLGENPSPGWLERALEILRMTNASRISRGYKTVVVGG